jgi:hypothetical protein
MAAKRARVEAAPSFEDVDLEVVSLKEGVKVGDGLPILWLAVPGEPTFRFNLTPSGFLPVIYGFDTSGKFEQPSFLTGKAAEKTTEGLSVRIGVEGVQLAFLQKLDDKMRAAMVKIDSAAVWQPLVTPNELYKNHSVKVHVTLKGNSCASLKVFGEEVLSGSGWNFLEPQLELHNRFRKADAKLVVRVSRVWRMGNKAGLSLEATQLALKPAEKMVDEDAFPDDVEW